MILGTFYTINEFVHEGEHIEAVCMINPKDDVFQGHFPGQPVVPGMYLLQLSKELIEQALGLRLFMHEAKEMKFSRLIQCAHETSIRLLIDYQEVEQTWSCKTQVMQGDELCSKMQCSYKVY